MRGGLAKVVVHTLCLSGIFRRAENAASSRPRRDLRRHYDSLQLLWDCLHTISAVCCSVQRRLDACGGASSAAQMDLLLMDEVGFLLGTHAPVSNSPSTPSFTNVLQPIATAASDVLMAVGGAPRLALRGKDFRGGYGGREFEGLGAGTHCQQWIGLQLLTALLRLLFFLSTDDAALLLFCCCSV